MAAQRHVIKKYANRKLYDTQTSRYITLGGISELVREGHDIQVIERDTGRDLTSVILSQIMATEEKRGRTDGAAAPAPVRAHGLFDYVRQRLSGPAALVSSTVERGRSDLEELVDLAVERALERFSIPTRRDLEALSARIAALERRLDRVTRTPSRPVQA